MKMVKKLTVFFLISLLCFFVFYVCDIHKIAKSVLRKAYIISSKPWVLTIDEKRKFLHYYSPIIFKASNETINTPGFDWITNFNFDKDMIYKNNKKNWKMLYSYIYEYRYSNWQIRPTLYTFIIEFMNGNKKSIIIVYHIYHAMQLNSIHDWERVEMRFDNVSFTPNHGENLAYIVITEHGKHSVPTTYTGKDLNFFQTDKGKHPLIYQAGYSTISDNLTMGELHYVEQNIASILTGSEARVDLNGYNRKKKFHYIFLDEADDEAVEYFHADSITRDNAADLSVKTSKQIDVKSVPRITYELQDVADIIPSQLMDNDWSNSSARAVTLVSEIIRYDENNVKTKLQIRKDAGKVIGFSFVDAETEDDFNDNLYYNSGSFIFNSEALDDDLSVSGVTNERSGYINKSWFLGNYILDGASGYQLYGWDSTLQHIYFAHDGLNKSGTLLKSEYWHDERNGGFDGRWVQLFED